MNVVIDHEKRILTINGQAFTFAFFDGLTGTSGYSFRVVREDDRVTLEYLHPGTIVPEKGQ